MSLALSSGYFLVFHGSRDRRGSLILSKLVDSLSIQLADRLILTQRKYLQQSSAKIQSDIRNYTVNLPPLIAQEVARPSKIEIPSIATGSLELTTIPLAQKN